MKRRIINCYVYPENNNIILRFIEIQEENASRLAQIASSIHYANVDSIVDAVFDDNFVREIGQLNAEALAAIPGMQAAHELIEYVNNTIGNRTPEEYKPELLSQLKNLAYQGTNIFENLLMNYADFNQVPWQHAIQANALSEDTEKRDNAKVRANVYPYQTYAWDDYQFILSSDPKKLCMFLGSLDGALHHFKTYAAKHDLEITFQFSDQKPNNITREEMISQSLKNECPPGPTQELSRFISDIMLRLDGNEPGSADGYRNAVNELKRLLPANSQSLTKPIRDHLYPDMTTAKFLDDYCKDDLLMADLLDPDVSFVEASHRVTAKLREQLSKKRKIDTTQPSMNNVEQADSQEQDDISSDDVKNIMATAILMHDPQNPAQLILTIATTEIPDNEPKRKFASPIHRDIARWFGEFDYVRELFWNAFVNKLYGHRAYDGGFYTSSYTEIELMKECDMHLNKQGFMELDIFKDKGSVYDQHYAKGRENYSSLEQELRQAFGLIGLHFQPNIDFHNEPIVFDRASTKLLMNRGMHYTEDYCKKLMQASHRQRLFAPNTTGNNALIQSDLLPNEMKYMIARQVEPDIHPDEDWDMRGMKIAWS